MKKTIAIVAGGNSGEYPVSLRSAESIFKWIDRGRYVPYQVVMRGAACDVVLPDGKRIPIDRNDFSFVLDGKKCHFDFAYITVHGTPGENGLLQGYFEWIGLPYSGCNVLASALTFHKYRCNKFLKSFGVQVADSVLLSRHSVPDWDQVVSEVGLPCFVKPVEGGSSIATAKVASLPELQTAVAKAAEVGDVIVESLLSGTELTSGCYKTRNRTVLLPLTEVVTSNTFFDYDAKYNGQVSEITPARIDEATTERVKQLTSRIYDALGCAGLIRADYIVAPDGTIWLLEVNTTPGMTATSFIPQQVAAAGLTMTEVLNDLIADRLG